ncbi:MAG: phosphodiesterase [Acidobacteria bacterium RIFCSPLOWO2_02_FULL_65_29]|nr:MAG: phosphodiesterase [Acidobacteria bacterium RIFCSPLOWO2_02_FULL_65_29]
MYPTAVINLVGLTSALLGRHTPHLNALGRDGSCAPIRAVTPAVTCTAQATYLTGLPARQHGIVANGWYFRDLAQILFWRQSNRLVAGEKIWDTARRRDAAFTCANMFWWYNMYSSVDWSATPRPIYPADGRKIPEIYTHPSDLRERLAHELGPFPFFQFWGPDAGLPSSDWIAEAADAVDRWHAPTLLLAYLPHLDYDLQRFGPADPRIPPNVAAIDAICGRLISRFRERGRRVIVLSEYGLGDVTGPVHINRALRDEGLLAIRDELGTDALDPGASAAFAVADHQLAHVYVRDSQHIPAVKGLLQKMPGVEAVLERHEQAACGLDHERSGELVAIAAADSWFTYYYWTDDRKAPDFARTVDIHRKPGYDPAELFLDPVLLAPRLRIAATLARKALGFRYLLNVVPLDATLVRGSHGRPTDSLADGPVFMSSEKGAVGEPVDATSVRDLMLAHLFDRTVEHPV